MQSCYRGLGEHISLDIVFISDSTKKVHISNTDSAFQTVGMRAERRLHRRGSDQKFSLFLYFINLMVSSSAHVPFSHSFHKPSLPLISPSIFSFNFPFKKAVTFDFRCLNLGWNTVYPWKCKCFVNFIPPPPLNVFVSKVWVNCPLNAVG